MKRLKNGTDRRGLHEEKRKKEKQQMDKLITKSEYDSIHEFAASIGVSPDTTNKFILKMEDKKWINRKGEEIKTKVAYSEFCLKKIQEEQEFTIPGEDAKQKGSSVSIVTKEGWSYPLGAANPEDYRPRTPVKHYTAYEVEFFSKMNGKWEPTPGSTWDGMAKN